MRRAAVTAWFVTVSLGVATSGSAREAQPVPPQGLYGNVFMSRQTGDLGGFEVRFVKQGGQLIAEHVLCEGWCNQAYRSEVQRDGSGFVFQANELITSGEGVSSHTWQFRVTPMGKRLRLETWYDGRRTEPGPGIEILRPLRRPFGLAVAAAAD